MKNASTPATTSETRPATGASLIASRLHAAGCRHVFGIPGGEVLDLLDALVDEGLAFTLCKHENAGGFMAEGSWHASGAPGVLLTTVGPGLVNAANVVANAWQDQVPLLVLSGCVDAAEAARYTHQVFDQCALMRPITKASLTLVDGAVDVLIDRAIAIATSDPQGPVHIDVPIGVAAREQTTRSRVVAPRAGSVAPAPGADLDAARQMLASAERPLMLAGLGAVQHGAGEQIVAFCERYGVPLLTTYKGKGLMPESHPLSLGGHGLSPLSDRHVMPLLAQADLVVLVGYDPIEMRVGWRDAWSPAAALELAHVPNRHGMHGVAFSFVCDAGAGLRALCEGVEPRAATWPAGEPASTRLALREAFGDRPRWGPHAAFAAARRAAPEDTVVSVDSGAHRILFSQMWSCDAPRTLLQSTALCTMGCALPLAIGYKLANPRAPVLAVSGDAGLEMTLGELATLRDLRLPVVVMVMVDESLALIELKQRRSQLANAGVDFGATDFVALATAMGGVGRAVSDAASLESAMAEAWTRDTFTLIACHIGRRAYDDAF